MAQMLSWRCLCGYHLRTTQNLYTKCGEFVVHNKVDKKTNCIGELNPMINLKVEGQRRTNERILPKKDSL